MAEQNNNDQPGELSHFSGQGRARMVDVSGKNATHRLAVATGVIRMWPATLERIRAKSTKKGDVLAVADVAAVMAAKRTSELIPMCHSLALSGVEVEYREIPDADASGRVGLAVRVEARCVGSTGVEMEALTGASGALLTIYDMCKAIDRGMVIEHIRLEEKQGGKSGHWLRSSDGEVAPGAHES